jgi:DNA-binding MarR family transcriptional regulator
MSDLTEAISYISDLIEKVLEETISQADFTDLTQQQLRYLQVISRMKNPTLTELARELDLTKPTVTVLADKLVEKGYIRRVKSDKDRRSMHLHIDKKGAKIKALREIAYERMAEIISSGLNETETSILTELLRKIVVNT